MNLLSRQYKTIFIIYTFLIVMFKHFRNAVIQLVVMTYYFYPKYIWMSICNISLMHIYIYFLLRFQLHVYLITLVTKDYRDLKYGKFTKELFIKTVFALVLKYFSF